MEKVTSDTILEWVASKVESKSPVSKEAWLEIAFKLNVLALEEQKTFNRMNRAVAQKKLDALKAQDKRNVAAAELEVEASEEYQFMKDQQAKVDVINQFIMIAKKNSDANW